MNWKNEWKKLTIIIVIFLGFYLVPVGTKRFDNAILEAIHLTKWYAQEHVLLCLIPAFFIAGAISVFISQASVMKYLGAKANKILSYGVASVSGSILAVCSCTVLPLFAGIYKMGAGLGPASAFLYSGPAINVLAIVLTVNVLGLELGIARMIGAVFFSIIIGILMHLIFYKEEKKKAASQQIITSEEPARSLGKNVLYFASLVGILVFANWSNPHGDSGIWLNLYELKWIIVSVFALLLGVMLVIWFNVKWWKILIGSVLVLVLYLSFPEHPVIIFTGGILAVSVILNTTEGDSFDWLSSSWGFAKQILPLLLIGILIAGALLGRVGHEGLIPSVWIEQAVGGNSFMANFFASFAGAFMYFATLTEIPILQGLIGAGMGKGPALALLLAGPALSLPNMLVIRSVMGTRKTIIFIFLIIVMSTISGMIYGNLFA
jgi:uncharacterized membrane protein YraQ (UPF0718 family)